MTVPFIRKRDLRGLTESTLSGHKLQLTTQFKYLGLTLNRGLPPKAQLQTLMYKVYTAFWACKGIWGLKPRVQHWIYTMVIRIILTYGCTV